MSYFAVELLGPAGIGKTTLCSELELHLRKEGLKCNAFPGTKALTQSSKCYSNHRNLRRLKGFVTAPRVSSMAYLFALRTPGERLVRLKRVLAVTGRLASIQSFLDKQSDSEIIFLDDGYYHFLFQQLVIGCRNVGEGVRLLVNSLSTLAVSRPHCVVLLQAPLSAVDERAFGRVQATSRFAMGVAESDYRNYCDSFSHYEAYACAVAAFLRIPLIKVDAQLPRVQLGYEVTARIMSIRKYAWIEDTSRIDRC